MTYIRSARATTIALLTLLATGCANQMAATVMPGTDLSSLKTMHVIHRPADNREINVLIRAKLEQLGVRATTGTREEAPANVDAVVTYADKWIWDITMYLLELSIVVRSPESDFPLAQGKSMHTWLTRKSPEEMVEEVIGNIYSE